MLRWTVDVVAGSNIKNHEKESHLLDMLQLVALCEHIYVKFLHHA
jgi:hypothetical protein